VDVPIVSGLCRIETSRFSPACAARAAKHACTCVPASSQRNAAQPPSYSQAAHTLPPLCLCCYSVAYLHLPFSPLYYRLLLPPLPRMLLSATPPAACCRCALHLFTAPPSPVRGSQRSVGLLRSSSTARGGTTWFGHGRLRVFSDGVETSSDGCAARCVLMATPRSGLVRCWDSLVRPAVVAISQHWTLPVGSWTLSR